eukprot:729744-Hanusia_phi.AAC.1
MEWTYEMRREIDKIVPNLFLGPYGAAKDAEELRKRGITHILIVRSTLERRLDPKFPNLIHYHIVEVGQSDVDSERLLSNFQVPEGPTENLILYFTECNACIKNAIESGGKILVHCNAGLSRSAAVVVAYVSPPKSQETSSDMSPSQVMESLKM